MDWIKAALAEKIAALGTEVVLRGPLGDRSTRAIIDPVQSVSEAARSARGLPDGYFPPGACQYFGPPEEDLERVTTVLSGDNCYFLRRKELCQVGGVKLYWWGLMIRGGTADAEG